MFFKNLFFLIPYLNLLSLAVLESLIPTIILSFSDWTSLRNMAARTNSARDNISMTTV